MNNYEQDQMKVTHTEVPIMQQGQIISPVADEETLENGSEETHFLQGPAVPISLEELERTCIVPSFSNNELTISHQNFIKAVQQAAMTVFPGDTISDPEIMVSHAQHGRIPSALHKKTEDLLDSEKTLYYQRCCFCIVLSRKDVINNQEVRLVVGGVRALNNECLGSKKGLEKFKLFIGFRVKICQNLCIFGDALIDKLEVMSDLDIYEKAIKLFKEFDPEANKRMLESLGTTTMTVEDITHILGKFRLYEAMSQTQRDKLNLPPILLGDQCANAVARALIQNPNFGLRGGNTITTWDFLNLLNESVKTSYIDKFLLRTANTTDIAFGIMNSLQEKDTAYSWFLA